MTDDTWMKDANCRGVDPNLFFPSEGESKAAKDLCAGCPVREVCLEFALENKIEHGTWGGLGENERRRVRRRRREGRVA